MLQFMSSKTVGHDRVTDLGQEDPRQEGMATHFSALAWRTPRTEESCGLQSIGSKESDTTEET